MYLSKNINFKIFIARFRVINQLRFSSLQAVVLWDNISRRFPEKLRSAFSRIRSSWKAGGTIKFSQVNNNTHYIALNK